MNKLKEMKATVQIEEPAKFKHLKKKLKKTQMLEGNSFQFYLVDRYTEIERENRILLEKMTNIMQNNKTALFSANAVLTQPSQQTSLQT